MKKKKQMRSLKDKLVEIIEFNILFPFMNLEIQIRLVLPIT